MLVVCRDEDDLRPLGEAGQHSGEGKPVEIGHRDVGENDVDVVRVEGLEGLGAGRRSVDLANPLVPAEEIGKLRQGRRLVVDEQRSQRRDGRWWGAGGGAHGGKDKRTAYPLVGAGAARGVRPRE